jgi:hypothetical protein
MLNPWYVTGFADGEAIFTYSKTAGSFCLYFSIKQRESNRQIVEDIQRFFNVGRIYKEKDPGNSSKNGATQPYAYYRVTKISELQVIVGHFDKFPLRSQKKLEAYMAWREMVMHKKNNYRRANYEYLSTLAQRISGLNL